MFRLSVCADTVFCDLPFEQRVKGIAQAGFLVEFWGWQGAILMQSPATPPSRSAPSLATAEVA